MRRGAAALAAAALLGIVNRPGAAGAQTPAVTLIGPTAPTLATATPSFRIMSEGFDPAEGAVTVRLQIALNQEFVGPLAVDTSIVADTADISVPFPLPGATSYWWRARARSDAGTEVISEVSGPHFVPVWLVLISPNAPAGSLLDTRRPQFVWRSVNVNWPPGPWIYDITITSIGTLETITATGLTDTVFVPAADLEANTSYRWAVTARLAQAPDTIRVASISSFVITAGRRTLATLLYQNFPNPFPSASTATTCVWFDLGEVTDVQLEVRDLRGNLVRQIYPTTSGASPLTAGQYGRNAPGGCDARFSWDGRADDGRFVSPGVYLLRLRTQRTSQVRKMLWQGSQ